MSTLEIDHSRSESERRNGMLVPASVAVSFSSGIRRLRHIDSFLGVEGVVSISEAARSTLPVSSVVVWGRKQNARRGLEYAGREGLPIQYVEDGWIRSCSENSHSRTSYSILVDDVGVYYDSTEPSRLENYLNLPDDQFDDHCGSDELAYAVKCRQKLVLHDITKYNYCRTPDLSAFESEGGLPLILVLDQTLDDASVIYGGMDQHAFNAMLDRALKENPLARVVVRTHPDVVAGRRKGYLQARAMELGVELSGDGDNPIPWLKMANKVYVGTSQLGYEALLCGCEVHVAGLPFYAGWGLTQDFQSIQRRIRSRTLDQLFHATHVYFARYCNPVNGDPWRLLDCIEHVCLQKQYFKVNARKYVCVGITPWKKRYIAQFLRSPDGEVRFSRRNNAAQDETVICWSFAIPEGVQKRAVGRIDDAQAVPSRLVRVEDGFLRSNGLGSDFVAPASLVFDEVGLYFDSSRESALELLLNEYTCSEDELVRARDLRKQILGANLTKYNVGNSTDFTSVVRSNPDGRKKILVVGQVEGDQSIIKGCWGVSSNSSLLRAVKEDNVNSFIVYKPHPDVESGNRKGTVDEETISLCTDGVETERHFLNCLDECDELHTMTSLSGFEAILRGKKVVTYGLPFYAGWGVTEDRVKCERRKMVRSVDELVYLCMAVYPRYIDIDCGEFITVEQLIGDMRARRSICGKNTLRWITKIRNTYAAMSYSV